MSDRIDNSADMLDSRDIIERIRDLSSAIDDLDSDETSELMTLTLFAEEGSDYSEDWQYGATLIRDSYFQEYAQQLAEDVGAIDSDAKWPMNCIDWEHAARELQHDYSAVDFDGVTYWVR